MIINMIEFIQLSYTFNDFDNLLFDTFQSFHFLRQIENFSVYQVVCPAKLVVGLTINL